MGKIGIILLSVLFVSTSFGQREKDILAKIYNYRSNIARNASYDKNRSDVWNAIYIIATEEYPTIVKESE